MNSAESRTLWISVGAALFAIFLLYSWSQDQKAALDTKFKTTKPVVVASEDIAEMETIDEAKLQITDVPVDFMQPESISTLQSVVGQVAAAPIRKGEQLMQNKLLVPGPETGLSLEVSPGKRAVTIPIDDMRGVSKLLKPGDRIDLLAAIDAGKGAEAHREIKIMLQDTPILATGLNVVNNLPRRFELDADGKRVNRLNLSGSTNFSTITIEAKPEEVQEIIFILSTSPSNLFTVLRNPADKIVQPAKSVSIEDVLGKPTMRAPTSAAVVPSFPSGPPSGQIPVQAAPQAAPEKRPAAKKSLPPGMKEL